MRLKLVKIFSILIVLLFVSCKTSITSPLTQIEYTGEISEKGLSITAKPPFYDFFIEMYKRLSGPLK